MQSIANERTSYFSQDDLYGNRSMNSRFDGTYYKDEERCRYR